MEIFTRSLCFWGHDIFCYVKLIPWGVVISSEGAKGIVAIRCPVKIR
jgi:hypothetical protein